MWGGGKCYLWSSYRLILLPAPLIMFQQGFIAVDAYQEEDTPEIYHGKLAYEVDFLLLLWERIPLKYWHVLEQPTTTLAPWMAILLYSSRGLKSLLSQDRCYSS